MQLMGSHYWNVNDEKSDKDYIKYVMPSKDDLYNCILISKSEVNPNGDDYNIRDIRMLVKELSKGSLISFQVLYNDDEEDDANINQCLQYARLMRDKLIVELKPNLMRSVQGELIGTYRRLQSHLNYQTIDFEENENKERKIKGHIHRLYNILKLLEIGKNPFKDWFASSLGEEVKGIRRGNLFLTEEVIQGYIDDAKNMNFEDKVKFEDASLLNDLNNFIKMIMFNTI